MTIEIVDFPIENGGSFQFAMLNYQRVYQSLFFSFWFRNSDWWKSFRSPPRPRPSSRSSALVTFSAAFSRESDVRTLWEPIFSAGSTKISGWRYGKHGNLWDDSVETKHTGRCLTCLTEFNSSTILIDYMGDGHPSPIIGIYTWWVCKPYENGLMTIM